MFILFSGASGHTFFPSPFLRLKLVGTARELFWTSPTLIVAPEELIKMPSEDHRAVTRRLSRVDRLGVAMAGM